ncbi:hypothetical protein [Tissierella sp.]|uniref:hypothetical protein n=1 Tax=Tissierella sp. TaxID=41274 RepID=UPI0030685ABB
MKMFKGNRNLEEIIQIAKDKNWEVDIEDFDKGGDWIWIRDLHDRLLQVVFNTFNGHFLVYSPVSDRPIATHLSKELDDKDWYNELLHMFYEDKKEELSSDNLKSSIV